MEARQSNSELSTRFLETDATGFFSCVLGWACQQVLARETSAFLKVPQRRGAQRQWSRSAGWVGIRSRKVPWSPSLLFSSNVGAAKPH